jgi:hypothetical protein
MILAHLTSPLTEPIKEAKMEQAVIIKTDGTKDIVEFEVGKSFDVIKNAVGGYFQVIGLPKSGVDLWVNEEGKLDNLPQNPIGTSIWVDEYGYTDVIVGNIIITGGADHEGETLGLSLEQVAKFMNYNRELWSLGF